MKNLFYFLLIAIGVFAVSCGGDDDTEPAVTCETTDITYTNTVAEILNNNCTNSGCHSADDAMSQGSLASYDDAVFFVSFGRILGALRHETDFSPMPFPQGADMLPACDIDKVEAWIAAGTPQ